MTGPRDHLPRPSTRWILGWAAALTVAVVAVAWGTGDLGGAPRAVVAATLPSPAAAGSETVWLSPGFELAGPTTLRVTLARDTAVGAPGWLTARVALVREDTGEVWETRLGTVAGVPGKERRRDELILDRLATGHYLLRVTPEWTALEGAADGTVPRATLRAEAGARSGWTAAVALALLWAPALAVVGWRGLSGRARRAAAPGTETTDERGPLAPENDADREAAAPCT